MCVISDIYFTFPTLNIQDEKNCNNAEQWWKNMQDMQKDPPTPSSVPDFFYKSLYTFFYKKPVYKKLGLKCMWYYNIFFCSIVNLNNIKQKKI